MLVGTCEKHGQPWSGRTTPWDFGHELLPDDLDRIGDNLMRAFEHFDPAGSRMRGRPCYIARHRNIAMSDSCRA